MIQEQIRLEDDLIDIMRESYENTEEKLRNRAGGNFVPGDFLTSNPDLFVPGDFLTSNPNLRIAIK
jgi:hypothetical protein